MPTASSGAPCGFSFSGGLAALAGAARSVPSRALGRPPLLEPERRRPQIALPSGLGLGFQGGRCRRRLCSLRANLLSYGAINQAPFVVMETIAPMSSSTASSSAFAPVFGSLKDAIMMGEFEPGRKLRIDEMARTFQTLAHACARGAGPTRRPGRTGEPAATVGPPAGRLSTPAERADGSAPDARESGCRAGRRDRDERRRRGAHGVARAHGRGPGATHARASGVPAPQPSLPLLGLPDRGQRAADGHDRDRLAALRPGPQTCCARTRFSGAGTTTIWS